jgi:uroporphyrinogen decarboxylase
MNHKERVLNALDHRGYDRIPVKHEATPEINQSLMEHLGVTDSEGLLERLGDDFRNVAPVWSGPELRTWPDGSWEGWWGERYKNISFGAGVYPEAVYLPFADVADAAELQRYRFPRADWFDYDSIKDQCDQNADYAIVFGSAGQPDFINGIARCRGVEKVLFDIAMEDPVFLALMEQRYEFFYEMTERALRAAKGLIDIVHFGEDLGTQNGLLVSPQTFERLFAAKYKALFALVHDYGARTMMHSCGSVRQLIPRLVEIGLDILDVIQVSAVGMGIVELHEAFGDRLCFCGSVCVQTTLPFGTAEEVCQEVKLRQQLFHDGGLILGPTHQIQVGTPLDNILAMYRCAGSLDLAGETRHIKEV